MTNSEQNSSPALLLELIPSDIKLRPKRVHLARTNELLAIALFFASERGVNLVAAVPPVGTTKGTPLTLNNLIFQEITPSRNIGPLAQMLSRLDPESEHLNQVALLGKIAIAQVISPLLKETYTAVDISDLVLTNPTELPIKSLVKLYSAEISPATLIELYHRRERNG